MMATVKGWGSSLMGGAASAFGTARNGAGVALGKASWAGAAEGSKLAGSSAGARLGMSAGAGAIYGGTIGRDEGQGRISGAMSGALGGAAMYGAARYGRAGYRNAQRTMGSRSAMNSAASGWGGFARQAGRMAGQGAFRAMKRDAMRASKYIGNVGVKTNRGVSAFAALHK